MCSHIHSCNRTVENSGYWSQPQNVSALIHLFSTQFGICSFSYQDLAPIQGHTFISFQSSASLPPCMPVRLCLFLFCLNQLHTLKYDGDLLETGGSVGSSLDHGTGSVPLSHRSPTIPTMLLSCGGGGKGIFQRWWACRPLVGTKSQKLLKIYCFRLVQLATKPLTKDLFSQLY